MNNQQNDFYDEYGQQPEMQSQHYGPRRQLSRKILPILLVCTTTAVVTLFTVVALTRSNAPSTTSTTAPPRTRTAAIPWHAVRKDISQGMNQARQRAEQHTRKELNTWFKELRIRSEDQFISEYLSYATQQQLAFKGAYYTCRKFIDGSLPTAEQALKIEVAEMFTRLVMQPPVMQAKLEIITSDAITIYLNGVSSHLNSLPAKYDISEAEFDHFIAGFSEITCAPGSTRRIPLVLKAATAVSVTGVALLAKPTARLAGTLINKLLGRAATQTASVASKGCSRLAGPLCLAVVIWDIGDHFVTVRKLRPVLIRSTNAYFDTCEESLVGEVMATVGKIEIKIVSAIQETESE